MIRTLESAAARRSRSGPAAASSTSASWLKTRLSAASGSVVKRQIARRSAGAGVKDESAARVRNWPRCHCATWYGPLPTRCASAVSPAQRALGIALHTWAGMTRT